MTSSEPSLLISPSMALAAVGQRLRTAIEERISPLGITMRHLSALGHLAHQPELSYSDLARRANVTSQSMRATIAHLVELGAVAVEAPGQGRSATLAVSTAGRRLLADARSIIADYDAAIASAGGFDPEAGEALVDGVARMARAARSVSAEDGAL